MEISSHGPQVSGAVVAGCVEVYRSAFAEPPYAASEEEVRGFQKRLRDDTGREGFRLLTASASDGRIVGFAEAVGPALTRQWIGAACTHVVTIAVSAQRRRSGIGTVLLAALVEAVDTKTALLAVHPEGVAAQRLYQSRGWMKLADGFVPEPQQTRYWVMGKSRAGAG
jgi:ribosomal protein S18 acetylase RimI-like enzyme